MLMNFLSNEDMNVMTFSFPWHKVCADTFHLDFECRGN